MQSSSTGQRLISGERVAALQVRDLGRMSYAEAFSIQKQVQQEVIDARETDGHMTLLLVEHDPPVITISRRPGAMQHLIATQEQLQSFGVEVAETDRGGDITYHGPGQLVAYPILDLNRLGLRLASYMRFLEQIVIDVLRDFNINGIRDAGATGVWVPTHTQTTDQPHTSSASKICAMGVRVAKWVSMHGFALNVTTNLKHFDLIVPCGLAGRTVTSMQRELGDACPHIDLVKTSVAKHLQQAIANQLMRSRSGEPS